MAFKGGSFEDGFISDGDKFKAVFLFFTPTYAGRFDSGIFKGIVYRRDLFSFDCERLSEVSEPVIALHRRHDRRCY